MQITRRGFLKGTLAGATLACSIADLKALCAPTDRANSGSVNSPKPPALNLPKIDGRIIVPGTVGYDEARRDYNARFNVSPDSILFCNSESDVIKAVKWARQNKIAVSVRSGGHSYEAFSLIDKGAVIDVSDMTNITVNAAKTLAKVQSGVTLLPLCETLWEKRVVIPVGSCATVGIAGSTLGGGYGLLARSMGLTCDNLAGVRMVNSHGDIVVANEHQNSDLLWACRGGGGGNFGIVTEFTFRLHPIENVSIVRLRWKWQEAAEVMRAWQDWAYQIDDKMTSILTVSSKTAASLLGLAMCLGSPARAQSILKPLLAKVKPERFSVTSMPFIKAQREFSGLPTKKHNGAANADSEPPPEPVHMHLHERFKGTSDYVRAALDDSAITTIIDALSESPSDSSCVQFDCYGGAIGRVPVKDTAFCHRGDTRYCLHYQISWSQAAHDSSNVNWINDFRKDMQPHVSGYTYQNYCDHNVDNWLHSYYGENLTRLISVKRKYDPDNFFRFPQSIPRSAQAREIAQ
jgi:FAD/FMN-containing dehydrogenase